MKNTNIIKIKKEDRNYPESLRKIKNPPKELYAIGNIELLNKKEIIAIVGSRNCTEYGRKHGYLFSNEIAKQDITIISGMAIGIDTAAHLGAVEENGKTIAVLGGGLKDIYPKENEWLFYKILKNGGCIITEKAPEEKTRTSDFPKRNRIISGLAKAVLVVEAKGISGSGITARYAKEQEKEVFCIPSNIDSINGNGTNMLIQKGATLVTNPKQIIDKIIVGARPCPCPDKRKSNIKINDNVGACPVYAQINIPEQYKPIYEILEQRPMYTNEISKILNINLSELNSIITMMELEGYIEQIEGNRLKIIGG